MKDGRSDPDRQVFDLATSVGLAVRSTRARLIFSVLYAGFSLSFAPWPLAVAWLTSVVAWDLIIRPKLDRLVLKRCANRWPLPYAASNFIGGALFCLIGGYGLSQGTALGAAFGVTWLTGYALACFVYFGANRWLLSATLVPGLMASILGVLVGHGWTWSTLLIVLLITCNMISHHDFSLDQRNLMKTLAAQQTDLMDLENKLGLVLEASGDGLFELDVISQVMTINDTWKEVLGYHPSELPSRLERWTDLIDPDDFAQLQKIYEAHYLGQTPHATLEHRVICKDGVRRWVLSRGRLVRRTAEGRPWKVVGAIMDLTERKATERQLELSRDVAEGANRAKDVFLANISHEIRTPLNGIIATTDALSRTPLSQTQIEMLSLVKASGQTLERLVTDILDQTRIDSGDIEINLAPVDLRLEIDKAAKLMRAHAEEKGLLFNIHFTDATAGAFMADGVRVRQIVSNLASNAIKFTQVGEVRICVDCVGGGTDDELERLTISVTDTGIGFGKDFADRLFTRFAQADASISRRFGGAGLGLAICKGLADGMGGSLRATSEPGRGSRFVVELPMRRAVSPVPGSADVGDQQTHPSSRLKVLLVEDHPINRKVVQLILEPLGVELEQTADGREALAVYRPGLFDVILMDMQMPIVNGLEATSEIRRLEAENGSPRTPIAILTANAMAEHTAAAAVAGADFLIAKPVTMASLLYGIDAAIEAATARDTKTPTFASADQR